MEPASLYIHIPFCVRRCGYCDFNTYAGLESLIEPYVNAVCLEIKYWAEGAPEEIGLHTIFFGGGTPSVLPIPSFEKIINAVATHFWCTPRLEMTLEANPGTVTLAYLRGLRALGFNRISMGMQSANAEELQILDRSHGFLDVTEAVRWARRAGFDNLSLDLIFGLPGQPLENWQRSLDLALGFTPEHISLYSLTVEAGTLLEKWVGRGLLPEPDEDIAADMYEWTMERLEQAGFWHYEISNWAKRKDYECRHNMQYWRNLPYIGIGAGAHGSVAGMRLENARFPGKYIQRIMHGKSVVFPRTPATARVTAIDRDTEMRETMLLGLRLLQEGVSQIDFIRRFDQPFEVVFGREIETLKDAGLVEWIREGKALRLTRRGGLVGNQVFVHFV